MEIKQMSEFRAALESIHNSDNKNTCWLDIIERYPQFNLLHYIFVEKKDVFKYTRLGSNQIDRIAKKVVYRNSPASQDVSYLVYSFLCFYSSSICSKKKSVEILGEFASEVCETEEDLHFLFRVINGELNLD